MDVAAAAWTVRGEPRIGFQDPIALLVAIPLLAALMLAARLVIASVLDVFARLLRVTGLDDPSRSMLHYVSAARQVDLPAYEHRHFSGRTLLRGQGWRLQPSHSLVYSSRAPSTMSPRGSRHVWLRDRAQS